MTQSSTLPFSPCVMMVAPAAWHPTGSIKPVKLSRSSTPNGSNSDFVIRSSAFGFPSSFGIRHSSLSTCHSSFSPRHGDLFQDFLNDLGDTHAFDFKLRPENQPM